MIETLRGLRLEELVRDLPIERRGAGPSGEDPVVSGVAHDSRRVEKGDLFVAVPGASFDGREFAGDAVARGAVAVVAAEPPAEPVDVPWLVTAEPRKLLGPLAARVYGHPEREMTLVGITGTNGKTTLSVLCRTLLDESGRPAGVLGSIAYAYGDWSEKASRTTPESGDLMRLLRRMRDDGAEAAAMEVSSHGLVLGRVDELRFDVAAFTNLTRDHFDFHEGFEDYYQAKKSLFDRLRPDGRAVIHVGDEHGRRLFRELLPELGRERIVTYAATQSGDGTEPPDVVVRDAELTVTGTRLELNIRGLDVTLASLLRGRFNVENLTAAMAVGEALEIPHDTAVRALERVLPIPGRMEPVDRGQPFPVFIDYSHTPASLEAALTSLRELVPGKILVVFGCGGDRDPGKRPIMGRIAGELADLPLVTSDNPRTEDPMKILAEVEVGLKESGNPRYRIVPDRREAIHRAVSVADEGWAVLIAGKGNEPIQVLGTEKVRFLDKEEVEKALEARFGKRDDD